MDACGPDISLIWLESNLRAGSQQITLSQSIPRMENGISWKLSEFAKDPEQLTPRFTTTAPTPIATDAVLATLNRPISSLVIILLKVDDTSTYY